MHMTEGGWHTKWGKPPGQHSILGANGTQQIITQNGGLVILSKTVGLPTLEDDLYCELISSTDETLGAIAELLQAIMHESK